MHRLPGRSILSSLVCLFVATGMLARLLCVSSAEAADKFEYRMVGDNTGVEGMLGVKVEGVGLVIGLNDTGSDPPPNQYREMMIDRMRKAEIFKPTELLASEKTAIVLLRAYIPPGIRKGDMIDVEVWVPPGDTTTSLKGGRLLSAGMYENMVSSDNRTLAGDELIKVEGPVLVTKNSSDPKDTAALLKGKILGQGRSLIDRDFGIVLSKEEQSVRASKYLAQQINMRFFAHDQGRKVGMANPKNDKLIELKLAKQYRYDIQRYLLVVRRIPLSTSDSLRGRILEYLEDELLKPSGTVEAALRLEAVGKPAVPVLLKGLESPNEAVRFSSAQALAHLDEPSCIKALAHFAENHPAYRAYALSAIVALDSPASRINLTSLLQSHSAESRYGAFRALWMYDARDPVVRGEMLGPYGAQLVNAADPSKPKFNDECSLHLIPSKAPPMVHISRSFRREIVLFNSEQQLLTPFSLRAGDFIMLNASPGADRVHLVSFQPANQGVAEKRAESDLTLANVLREAARLGATYPDLVDLLQQAQANGNLMGRLEINALPRALSMSSLESIASNDDSGESTSSGGALPSLFSSGEVERSRESAPRITREGMSEPKDEPKKKSFWNIFRSLSN